jgi:hypothetical protein
MFQMKIRFISESIIENFRLSLFITNDLRICFLCGMLTENQFHFQFVTSFKLLSQSPAKGVVLEGGEAGVETGGAGNPVRIRVF